MNLDKVQQIQYICTKNIYQKEIFITDTDFISISICVKKSKNQKIDAFGKLIDSQYYIDNENSLQQLIYYFEDTWIGRPMGPRKGRRLPKYPICLWNCYESVNTLLPRNNNEVEGWVQSIQLITSWSILKNVLFIKFTFKINMIYNALMQYSFFFLFLFL